MFCEEVAERDLLRRGRHNSNAFPVESEVLKILGCSARRLLRDLLRRGRHNSNAFPVESEVLQPVPSKKCSSTPSHDNQHELCFLLPVHDIDSPFANNGQVFVRVGAED